MGPIEGAIWWWGWKYLVGNWKNINTAKCANDSVRFLQLPRWEVWKYWSVYWPFWPFVIWLPAWTLHWSCTQDFASQWLKNWFLICLDGFEKSRKVCGRIWKGAHLQPNCESFVCIDFLFESDELYGTLSTRLTRQSTLIGDSQFAIGNFSSKAHFNFL